MATIGKLAKLQIQGDDGEWLTVGATMTTPKTVEAPSLDIRNGFEIDAEVTVEIGPGVEEAWRIAMASDGDPTEAFMAALEEQGEDNADRC